MNKLMTDTQKNKLASRLEKFDFLKKCSPDVVEEANTIAQSMQELEESFINFQKTYLIKLLDEKLSEDEVKNLMFEIGEEFKHIFYHLRDAEFFKIYISEDSFSD